MPGIIVFKRRWSLGSDDLIVPAGLLVTFHAIWLIVLTIATVDLVPSLQLDDIDPKDEDVNVENSGDDDGGGQKDFLQCLLGFLCTWSLAILVEGALVISSLRGTILEDELRWHSEYLLYIKLVQWVIEIIFTILSVIWLKDHYVSSNSIPNGGKNVMLGIVICNCILFLTGVMCIWCSYDVAGRSWVKLKNYQKSQQSAKKIQFKRSGGNLNRSWRHRKVRRAYQNSWDSRCKMLLCCVNSGSGKGRSSFTDIAKVLSEFFRDLDIVPSDVIVGLVLLRKRQQLLRLRTIHQANNPVYQFLSGVRITPKTVFLDPTDETEMGIIRQIHHFMHFAVAVYGWPMYLRKNTATGICKLCSSLRCSCCWKCSQKPMDSVVLEDNCCGCNFAAFRKMCHLPDTYVVYVTYHVDVGEIPFLVALDYSQKAIVISIRGTLSLEDIVTDLNAEGEPLPIRPINEEWIGHKGMSDTAAYIYKRLKEEHLLTKAFNWDQEQHTDTFDIVCVGHSLGAGTATILAIMLKQEFPNTKCFAYSPPGGLLSQEAVEYSKSFVTSIVLGKDVVPRIGLHQLEALRHDLIYAIHKSTDPKWKTLMGSMVCCTGGREEWTAEEVEAQLSPKNSAKKQNFPDEINIHPWDSTVNLSVHQPLYPPGKIIHLVRYYPQGMEMEDRVKTNPIWKAIWADNTSFDEVLISKRMVQDHMPDNVLLALTQLTHQVPQKPCQGLKIVIQEPSSERLHGQDMDELKVISDHDIKCSFGSTENVEATKVITEDITSHLDETHFIETIQYQESLPLVDESAAPIASPDDCLEEIQTSSSMSAILTEKTDPRAHSPCGGTTRKTASNAKSIPTTSTSYPAFHSVQSEYLKSTVHIEPFYRYRVHSDA